MSGQTAPAWRRATKGIRDGIETHLGDIEALIEETELDETEFDDDSPTSGDIARESGLPPIRGEPLAGAPPGRPSL